MSSRSPPLHWSVITHTRHTKTTFGSGPPSRPFAPIPCAQRGTMDGQDGDAQQRRKPHGNPYPKRGAVKKEIIRDWFGKKDPGSDGDNGKDNGGGGDDGGATAAGSYGDY